MDRKHKTLQAGGERIEVFKSCLKEWISLDEAKEQIYKNPTPDGIFEYLFRATGKDADFWKPLPWFEIAQAYLDISLLNQVEIELPILDSRDGKSQSNPWDYPGRGWYVWLNMFAKAYSWQAEYIAKLEVEDAFALFQELETDRQLQREWEWQLTEIAYPYNANSKKNEFHTLPRPSFMRLKAGPPKPVRIRRDLLPVGNVIDLMHYVNPESSL